MILRWGGVLILDCLISWGQPMPTFTSFALGYGAIYAVNLSQLFCEIPEVSLRRSQCTFYHSVVNIHVLEDTPV